MAGSSTTDTNVVDSPLKTIDNYVFTDVSLSAKFIRGKIHSLSGDKHQLRAEDIAFLDEVNNARTQVLASFLNPQNTPYKSGSIINNETLNNFSLTIANNRRAYVVDKSKQMQCGQLAQLNDYRGITTDIIGNALFKSQLSSSQATKIGNDSNALFFSTIISAYEQISQPVVCIGGSLSQFAVSGAQYTKYEENATYGSANEYNNSSSTDSNKYDCENQSLYTFNELIFENNKASKTLEHKWSTVGSGDDIHWEDGGKRVMQHYENFKRESTIQDVEIDAFPVFFDDVASISSAAILAVFKMSIQYGFNDETGGSNNPQYDRYFLYSTWGNAAYENNCVKIKASMDFKSIVSQIKSAAGWQTEAGSRLLMNISNPTNDPGMVHGEPNIAGIDDYTYGSPCNANSYCSINIVDAVVVAQVSFDKLTHPQLKNS